MGFFFGRPGVLSTEGFFCDQVTVGFFCSQLGWFFVHSNFLTFLLVVGCSWFPWVPWWACQPFAGCPCDVLHNSFARSEFGITIHRCACAWFHGIFEGTKVEPDLLASV